MSWQFVKCAGLCEYHGRSTTGFETVIASGFFQGDADPARADIFSALYVLGYYIYLAKCC